MAVVSPRSSNPQTNTVEAKLLSSRGRELRIFKFCNVEIPICKYEDDNLYYTTKDIMVIAFDHDDARTIILENAKKALEQQGQVDAFWTKIGKDNNLPKDSTGYYNHKLITGKTKREWMNSPDYPKVPSSFIVYRDAGSNPDIDGILKRLKEALEKAGSREIAPDITHGTIIY